MIADITLDGIWERNQRNPLVGALVLVLGIGTFYFLAQSLLLNAYVLVDSGRAGGFRGHGDLYTRVKSAYQQYQVAILVVLPLTEFGILLLVPLIVVRRWHTRQIVRYFRFDRFPPIGVLLSVLGVLFLLPESELLARFIYSFFPGLEKLAGATGSIVEARSTPVLILILFSVALTPAICEETLFRGYLQRTLERKIKVPWHFLISGLLFALFHQQIVALPSLILVGVYLGFIYNSFQSIYPGMFAHFAYNGAIIWMANSRFSGGFFFGAAGNFTSFAVAVSGASFTMLLILMILMRRRAADGPRH